MRETTDDSSHPQLPFSSHVSGTEGLSQVICVTVSETLPKKGGDFPLKEENTKVRRRRVTGSLVQTGSSVAYEGGRAGNLLCTPFPSLSPSFPPLHTGW